MTYKSVDKKKIKIIMILCACTKQQRFYRIEHAGNNSISGQPYSTSGTLLLLFVQQTCQNIAGINSIFLVQ